jgi:hypothetical protein
MVALEASKCDNVAHVLPVGAGMAGGEHAIHVNPSSGCLGIPQSYNVLAINIAG